MNEIVTERFPLGEVDEDRCNNLSDELGRSPSELEFVRKGYVAESKGTDDDERSSTELISTANPDRDNEILLPKGAVLEHYKKNPQVLWAHDYRQPPIGKAAWVKKDTSVGGLLAKTMYAATEFAEEIWSLVKGGFLPARSVGFIPIESHEPDEKEITRHPDWAGVRRVYDEWELLEYSVVPVPSNRQALQMAVGKDISLSAGLLEQLGLVNDVEAADRVNRWLGQKLEVKAEDVDIEDKPKKETELIKLPSVVKSVILVPKVIKVISVPKKSLDIRKKVARVVSEEIDRQRGRV